MIDRSRETEPPPLAGDGPRRGDDVARPAEPVDRTSDWLPTPEPDSPASGDSPPAGATPQVSCPHCRSTVPVADPKQVRIACSGCGNSFRLQDTGPSATADEARPLGKFQLLECVGKGAFGAVWRARDTELQREVALKIPHPSVLESGTDRERFYREARAAAQLRHPGIVTVHEVAELGGQPAIVSEYIDGLTLHDLLKVRKLSFREAASLVAAVAEALDYAHGIGLVHRDIKPANIMIEFAKGDGCGTSLEQPVATGGRGSSPQAGSTAAGSGTTHASASSQSVRAPRPVLLDFGLVLREEVEITMTVAGQILGTPAYMSPEQAAGRSHQVDRRSDIYTLGVVLYELLCGELPFRGNRAMLVHQILREEPRSARRVNDRIPRDLETIVLKCLAKDPARRYGSAGDLAADLRRWLAGELILARPVGRLERVWRWAKRNPRVALLSAAVVLLILGVVVGSTVSVMQIAAARSEAARRQETARRSLGDTVAAVDWMRGSAEFLRYYPALQDVCRLVLSRAVATLDGWKHELAAEPALHARVGATLLHIGELHESLGEPAAAVQMFSAAHDVFSALSHDNPDSVEHAFWLAACQSRIAGIHRAQGQLEAATSGYEIALRGLARAARDRPDQTQFRREYAAALRGMALVHRATQQHDEAEAMLRQAIAQFEQIKEVDPASPAVRAALAGCRQNLANLLSQFGRTAEAMQTFDTARLELHALAREDPNHPDYAEALAATRVALGHELIMLGRGDAASLVYKDAFNDFDELLAAVGERPQFRLGWGRCLNRIAESLHHDGRNVEAEMVLNHGEEPIRRFIARHADVPDYGETLAVAQTLRAHVLVDLARPDAALEAAQEAAAVYLQSLDRQPNRREHREGLAYARLALGRALQAAGRLDDAKRVLGEAILGWKGLVDESSIPEYRHGLARALRRLGDCFTAAGQKGEAAAAYRQALGELEQLARELAGTPRYARDLAWMLATCADPQLRDANRAVALAQQSLTLSPDSRLLLQTLGVAQYRAGEWRSSVESLERAVRASEPQQGWSGFFLAMARARLGESEAAREILDRATSWLADNAVGNEELTGFRLEAAEVLGVPDRSPDPE